MRSYQENLSLSNNRDIQARMWLTFQYAGTRLAGYSTSKAGLAGLLTLCGIAREDTQITTAYLSKVLSLISEYRKISASSGNHLIQALALKALFDNPNWIVDASWGQGVLLEGSPEYVPPIPGPEVVGYPNNEQLIAYLITQHEPLAGITADDLVAPAVP